MNPFIKILLFPISIMYGLFMQFRNWLFNCGLLQEKEYPIPIINVGNLTVGGTGKTPHVEYLIRLLSTHYRVATLSSGYKRKTSGYLKANASHSFLDIGDEPLQYFQKFPNIIVAVCKSRKIGISKLLSEENPPQVILLDDAYQHRFVKPSINILLSDYMNLYVKDFVIPCGKLREFNIGSKRADMVVITKTETVLSSIVKKMITNDLKLLEHQKLFFSYIDYGNPIPLFNNQDQIPSHCVYIHVIAGIANPYPMQSYLKQKCSYIKVSVFPDHHQFSKTEIINIISDFKAHLSVKKVIITTEKDAKRLQNETFQELFQNIPIFYIPMTIKFHNTHSDCSFDSQILQRVSNILQQQ